MTTRLQLPAPPADPPPQSLPMLAMLAPVVGSIVLWLVLQTTAVLMFALLGPLIGVASVVDGRIARRRQRAREAARFDRECAALAARIDELHVAEAERLAARHQDARVVAHAAVNDPHRWRWTIDEPLLVHVGVGCVDSELAIDAYPQPHDAHVEREAAALLERAATLEGPVLADARLGIGVTGPARIAGAVARSIVLQLVDRMPPGTAQLIAVGEGWSWLDELPHEVLRDDGDRSLVRIVADGAEATVAVACDRAALPRDCRVEVHAALDACVVDGVACAPVVLSAVEVASATATLARAATAAGMRTAAAVPAIVRLDELAQPDPGVLAATFLHAGAPMPVDLVADGPHAVVGGTTGAGKSELLIAWITALASLHPPDRLAVLLVDFKGGASFGALTGLAHCVGVITDLDEHQAARAIESLRAEMRHRERVLAEQGARSIDEARGLERLVIVVDEFAAMLHDLPDLHRLFADVAARGRSLGMHLILCTQRPAEAVRDTVLANCGLRISLRVTDEADALAITDVRDAAHIRLEQRGRCVVRVAGRDTVHAQSAIVQPAQLAALVAASRRHEPPRRPWCEPLPTRVDPAGIETQGITLGLVDRPFEQRVDPIGWRPEAEGPMLVLGASATGKSHLARLLARAGGEVIADEEALWDALHEPLTEGLTVIDDLDLLLARVSDEHAPAMAAMLATRMREGAAAGRAIAITARRVSTAMAQLAPLADVRILLRLASRQEHVVAGGLTSSYDASLPAGGGWLGSERIQLACVDEPYAARSPQRVPLPEGPVAFVVASDQEAALLGDGTRPADVATGAHGDRVAGTTADWEAAWGALDRLRAERPVVTIGVDERAVRSVLRGAPLPPVTRGAKRWVLEGGRFLRLA